MYGSIGLATYTANAFMGVNDSIIFKHNGIFSTENQTSDFALQLNEFLKTCIPDSHEICNIPLTIHSDTGIIEISAVNITYDYNVSKLFSVETSKEDVYEKIVNISCDYFCENIKNIAFNSEIDSDYENYRLFSSNTSYNFTIIDDTIQWNVPFLSNQEFKIEADLIPPEIIPESSPSSPAPSSGGVPAFEPVSEETEMQKNKEIEEIVNKTIETIFPKKETKKASLSNFTDSPNGPVDSQEKNNEPNYELANLISVLLLVTFLIYILRPKKKPKKPSVQIKKEKPKFDKRNIIAEAKRQHMFLPGDMNQRIALEMSIARSISNFYGNFSIEQITSILKSAYDAEDLEKEIEYWADKECTKKGKLYRWNE